MLFVSEFELCVLKVIVIINLVKQTYLSKAAFYMDVDAIGPTFVML